MPELSEKSYFNRFLGGLTAVKNTTANLLGETSRRVPGVLKVTGMGYMGIFTGSKAAAYIHNVEDGLDTYLGLVLAIGFCVATMGDCIVGRYFFMVRRANQKNFKTPPITPAAVIDAGQTNRLPNHPDRYPEAGFISHGQGHQTLITNALYVGLNITASFYMLNSGISGFLSQFSFTDLITRIPGLSYDGTCGPNQSEIWKIALDAAGGAAYGFASSYSFLKYNFARGREYMIHLRMEGKDCDDSKCSHIHWKNVTWNTILETMLSVIPNVIGTAFSTAHTWLLLYSNIFCHMKLPGYPPALLTFLNVEAAENNFFITTLMNLIAVQKRNSQIQKKELYQALEDVPELKRLVYAIRLCNFFNAVGQGWNTFLGMTTLPGLFNDDLKSLAYEPGMIVAGAVLGLIQIRCQFAVSTECFFQEVMERAKINKLKALEDSNSLQASLLAENAANSRVSPSEREHETSLHVDVDESRDDAAALAGILIEHTGDRSLSKAKHSRLFKAESAQGNAPADTFEPAILSP